MSMAQLSFPTTLVLVPPGESITHTSITTFSTVFYHIFAIGSLWILLPVQLVSLQLSFSSQFRN
jgi:hypothetical protein